MKIVSCLSKFGALFTDREREEILNIHKEAVASGKSPLDAAREVVAAELASAKDELDSVNSAIFEAQEKAAPKEESVALEPVTEIDRVGLGDDIDVDLKPVTPTAEQMNRFAPLFAQETVPDPIGDDGARKATPSEQRTLLGAIRTAFEAGVQGSWLGALRYFATDGGAFAQFRTRTNTIGMKSSMLRAVGEGWSRIVTGALIHEVHHAIDSDGMGGFHSIESPLFATERSGGSATSTGELIREADLVMMNTQDERLRMMLLYALRPLMKNNADNERMDSIAKAELFAQLGRLYFTNRALMQNELPKAHAFFKEFNDVYDHSTLQSSRNGLREALRTWSFKGSVRDNDAARNDRGDGAGARQRYASAGLGTGPRVVDRGRYDIGEERGAGLDGGAEARTDRQGKGALLAPDTGPRTPSFGRAIKNAVTIVGVHYGNEKGLSSLAGGKFGNGSAGAESSRVKWASDDRLKKRVYFYAQTSDKMPRSEGVVLGNHVYRVRLNNVYDLSSDTLGLRQRYETYGTDQFKNDSWLESQIIDAGYDGYLQRDFSPSPAVVVLNKDVPVEYLGTRKDAGEVSMAIDPVQPDVAKVAGLEAALKIAKSRVWNRGRDLKQALQDAIVKAAEAAGIDLESEGEVTRKFLVRATVADAKFALKQNPNAVGWYDEKTRQALAVMALVHPELATNEDAKLAFVWAMAVTSNGQRVEKNFELAEKAYERFKATGRMPTDLAAGQAQGAINDALGLYNTLRMAWGTDNLRRFMQSEFTVGDIGAIAAELKPGGEHVDVTVKGAAILGPKIGNGFFSNLYGDFRSLTMDRWLIRTWGRWTGTLIKQQPELTTKARERLTKAVAALNPDAAKALSDLMKVDLKSGLDDLAKAVQKTSMDSESRAAMNEIAGGLELRKAGNSLAKYLDGQKEAPSGPTERKFIRKVFGEALKELQSDPAYADLSMADLQAVLWYAEKRLYETAKEDPVDEEDTEGYSDEEAPDYANAASAVAREKGVSERKIKAALTKESKNGRAAAARSGNVPAQAGSQGQQGTAGGFAERAKRFFIGARAVDKARSDSWVTRDTPGTYARDSGKDGRRLRVLRALGVSYFDSWKPSGQTKNSFRQHDIEAPTYVELEATKENAQRFSDLITAAKAKMRFGAAVYVYPVDDYQQMRLFLAKDGLSGVAVKADGDIVSVFSTAGAGRANMELAVSVGGRKLDAFETVLPSFYAAHGFVATSRLKWHQPSAPADWDKTVFAEFNNGEPDVVFMVFDPRYRGDHKAGSGILYQGPDAYDQAVAEQGRGVKRVNNAKPSRPKYSIADDSVAGLKQSAVAAEVQKLVRGWSNAPAVTVLQSPSDAPFSADSRARGAFYNGEVFLFASNLRDSAEAQFTLLHEIAGHYGLRGILGDALGPMLQRIYDTNAKVRELAGDRMARFGYDQATATEEALSDLAGTGEAEKLTGWKMLVAAIRNLLRRAGISIEMSDNDVIALLADSRRFVERGKPGAATDGTALSERGPLWYSELEAKVSGMLMKIAPAQQWKATIKATKGIKPDEIEWSGVNEWLDLQQGKVTKDALLSYLRQNGVKVTETMLGAAEPPAGWTLVDNFGGEPDRRWIFSNVFIRGYGATEQDAIIDAKMKLERQARRWQKNGDEEKAQRFFAQADEFDSYIEARAGVGHDDTTRYSDYTMPGGKNYRELLLTLPTKPDTQIPISRGEAEDLRRAYAAMGVTGEEVEREINRPVTVKDIGFQSSHWDQPNILAHVRFNERTDADGKRVLFIEEIQSDWAQKGKKEGFDEGNGAARRAAIDKEIDDLREAMISRSIDNALVGDDTSADDDLRAMQRRVNDLVAESRSIKGSGIPAAPFVQKTDAWVSLAIKRMIRYAAENGFDRVAFVNGEQSADRYDLSKRVESVTLSKQGNGKYWLDVNLSGGGRRNINNLSATEVADHIGKELAERLIEAADFQEENTKKMRVAARLADGDAEYERLKALRRERPTTISGLDLKVGGEGMKTFYDSIVPKVAKEVAKKFGSQLIDDVPILLPRGTEWDRMSPEQREEANIGLDADEIRELRKPDGEFMSMHVGFDITDAMRESAMQGMPMFSKAQVGTPEFQRWFQNSKAVEPDGKPMRVFHGGFDFNSAKPNKGVFRVNNRGSLGVGAYFTPDVMRAVEYIPEQGGGMTEAYLSIQRPLIITAANGQDPVVEALVSLGVDRAKASSMTERAYEQHGYIGSEIKSRAQALGFDGIMQYRDGNLSEIVVWNPVQIKSATSNNGQYSWNPDIRYSLAQQAQDKLHDFFTTTNSFNLWDKTVGTAYHKASKHAGFKKVYDGVQRFLNDASVMMMNAATLAPDMLPRMDSLRDVLRKPVAKADMKAVSDAVFRGTLNDVVYQSAAAAGLTPHQYDLYRQTRAAIDRSLQDTFTSEAVKQARKILPDAVLKQAKDTSDPWVIVGALAAIPNRTDVQEQVYNQLRKAAAKMSDLQQAGYAPLMRFGRYTLNVSDAQGNSVLFTMHESESERNAFEREVRSDPQFASMSIKAGTMSQDAWTLFNGVSPDTLEVFADALGASNKEVYQAYLAQAVNNRSILKRLIQRKKIEGFNDDVQRTLAQFITSNGRAAARNYHWGDVLKAANDIPKEEGDAKDEAVSLIKYMENPKDEAGAIRGLLFVQFLGGSVASALTNATQPVMMTLPYLSKWGAAAAGKALLAASKVATGGAIAEPDLAAAMDFATKEGIIAPHEVADLYAEGIRNFGSNAYLRKGLKVWGSMFSLAEAFNRRLTFVAAFRMARDQQLGDPLEFATSAIAETQGVYNRGNRPNWARGPVGATMMTFKQYSIAYMEFLARLPRKQQMMALALLVLGAGLQGLPGADDLEDIVDTIAESLGYSFNSKKAMRRWAVSVLGDDLGGFLVLGASGVPGVPLDVSARLGLGNLIPGTAMFKRSETSKGRDVMEIFGPAGAQASALMDAFKAGQAGNWEEVAKSMAPLSFQNALKAMDMAQSGFYRDREGRRVTDVDAYDAMIKGIGFQPQKVAAKQRAAMDVQQDVNLVRDVEAGIVKRWAQGIVDKDPDRVAAAQAELISWNMKNPDWRIRVTPMQVQRRIREALLEREARMLKAAPAEVRSTIRSQL